jgi:hypothetical protein
MALSNINCLHGNILTEKDSLNKASIQKVKVLHKREGMTELRNLKMLSCE